MNLLLHGIGGTAEDGSEPDGRKEPAIPVEVKDGLAGKHGEYELVLTTA